MDKKQEKLLAKIRNMLEMANRAQGNEEEAAVASHMVENLMRKHNLSIEDITPAEAKKQTSERAHVAMKWTHGKIPTWVNRIAIAIAKAYDTFVIVREAGHNDRHVSKQQYNLAYVGVGLDVSVSLEMFAYLYKTVLRLADKWYADNPAPKGKARSHKAAYRDGMAIRLASRLEELAKEKEAEATSTGTGLMVVKKDAIAEHLGFEPEYTTTKRTTAQVDSAFSAGYTAGGSVSLNNQIA